MRISDWSSDVCSSDLRRQFTFGVIVDGEDQGCQTLRQQDLIETPCTQARPAGSSLNEGEGPRGLEALGKRQSRSRPPSPSPCPLLGDIGCTSSRSAASPG